MRQWPTVVLSRCGVVTWPELAAAGWTRDAVRHAVDTGRIERVSIGCFAPVPSASLDRFRQADLRLLRIGIAATLPDGRVGVSHLGAAVIRHWPIWSTDAHPCVTTWDSRVRRVAGLHLHRELAAVAYVRREGIVVTSAPRTIVDIAREFGVESALVSGDVALRLGDITRESLRLEVERCAGLPGIEAARRVGGLLDPLAESPLESRGRWHFDLHGIDRPLSQVWIYTRGRVFLGRVDHFWPEGVVGEADGRLKYLDPERPFSLDREKERHQALLDVDLEVVRWGAKDLRDFSAAAGRIERARIRARRHLTEGAPEWYALDSTGARVPLPGST